MGGVNAPGQVAGGRIIGHDPSLVIVVVILAVAVVEAGGPGLVEPVFGVKLRQVGIAVGNVKRFVKTRFTIDVNGLFGREIENRPAIERRIVVAMRVRHVHRGAVAKPGQGRGDKAALLFAKVAPVVFILIFADDPVRQPRPFDGPGDVKLAAAAAKAGGGRRNRAAEGFLRAFGHHVNQPAGVENAVQRRGRAFQHLHALGGGVEAARQDGAQPVGHNGTVAVGAETAAGKGVLGAAEGIGLHDVSDVIQRLVERGDVLIFQHPIADGVNHLRDIQQRH